MGAADHNNNNYRKKRNWQMNIIINKHLV